MTCLSVWRGLLVLCGLTLVLSACGKKAETPGRDTVAIAPIPDTIPVPTMSDGNIVAKLGWADSMEIEQAKLAQKQGKSAEVKSFAKMMIDEHTRMMKEGKAVAAKAKIIPAPQANDPDVIAAATRMAALKASSGAVFDSLYVKTAVEDHTKVRDIISAAIGMTKNPDLRAHLEKGRPVVQKHLDAAKALQGKLAGMK